MKRKYLVPFINELTNYNYCISKFIIKAKIGLGRLPTNSNIGYAGSINVQ